MVKRRKDKSAMHVQSSISPSFNAIRKQPGRQIMPLCSDGFIRIGAPSVTPQPQFSGRFPRLASLLAFPLLLLALSGCGSPDRVRSTYNSLPDNQKVTFLEETLNNNMSSSGEKIMAVELLRDSPATPVQQLDIFQNVMKDGESYDVYEAIMGVACNLHPGLTEADPAQGRQLAEQLLEDENRFICVRANALQDLLTLTTDMSEKKAFILSGVMDEEMEVIQVAANTAKAEINTPEATKAIEELLQKVNETKPRTHRSTTTSSGYRYGVGNRPDGSYGTGYTHGSDSNTTTTHSGNADAFLQNRQALQTYIDTHLHP